MDRALNVDRLSVSQILSDKERLYLIPEYQRPYEWDEDKCRTLWDDILEFAMPENNTDNFKEQDEYFLGSIVTFINEDKWMEIIDGQQRITTLLLLLRAIYARLEPAKDKSSEGVKRQIEPCIWQTDRITKEPDKNKVRIDTKVATDKDRDAFISILKNGKITGKDNYSRNYQLFQDWIEEYAKTYPTYFYDLCVRILENCILLPIDCGSQDVALRIFTTLNDRGMPLSDSDIFKAQLYKYYSSDNRQDSFIQNWQELSEICDDIAKDQRTNQNAIDEIFTLYMYWLRAKNNIKDTTVPGLRKYFEHNKYAKLKNDEVMIDVIALSKFWKCLSDKDISNTFGVSTEALKYIHCLEHFPNAFWKYNLTMFFFAYKDTNDKLNETEFEKYVKLTLAFCYVSYLINPTISKLKNASIPIFVEIANNNTFNFPVFSADDFSRSFHNIYTQSKMMIKPILLWEAYQINSQILIGKDTKLEVEHILPKNWQSGNYQGWNKTDANEYLEKIGNKILLDKKTNIQAGDGFFKTKKERWYKNAKIEVVKKLANDYYHDDWVQKDIESREKILLDSFIQFAKSFKIIS
jgi:uncharacterized protein with ParB-like and HNH nuclease domain